MADTVLLTHDVWMFWQKLLYNNVQIRCTVYNKRLIRNILYTGMGVWYTIQSDSRTGVMAHGY